ncbi:hypothetical protein WA556_003525 [Blastocystis sp. ATCC 50177/Nand II]
MAPIPKYTKSIAKALGNAANTISDDDESYALLNSLNPYIACQHMDYEREQDEIIIRSALLKLWSRLLLMLKTASYPKQNVIFQYISSVVVRSEFLLENCGYQEGDVHLDEKVQSQLVQYIFLLKLSLLYTPRAIVANTPNSRCFVFSTISSSILRIPEYRICFLTQLQGLIENTTDGIDNGIESLLFHCTSASFMDKYLDLPADGTECESRPSLPHLEGNDAPLTEMAKSAFEGEDQIHMMNKTSETSDSFASLSEGGHPTGIDMSHLAANIPAAYVIKKEQIFFHDDSNRSSRTKRSPDAFCYDDHNFDNVMIDDDYFENPYSTANIQDILRNHRYTLSPDEPNGELVIDDNVLPPLKLTNMNSLVDLMQESCAASKESWVRFQQYRAKHPSLFEWEELSADATALETTVNGERFVCNEEEGEGVQAKNENKEMIGDLYLDTQVIAVFGRSKALLVQFIIFYMSYIRSIHSPNDPVFWAGIPGFFLLTRLFLIHFQDFFVSKMSSGILRMNLGVEHILSDSIGYELCDCGVVDGRVLNIVLSILFDKCNVNVFLDISKSMMTFHNLLKAIRANNRVLNYHAYSRAFYTRVYNSPEIKLLLFLQQSNHISSLSSVIPSSSLMPPSPSRTTLRTTSLSPQEDHDLTQLDAISHTDHYYNNNMTIIYTPHSTYDVLCEATHQSCRKKDARSEGVSTEMEGVSTEVITTVSTEGVEGVATEETTGVSIKETTDTSTEVTKVKEPRWNLNYFTNRNVEGFTLLQGVYYLIENNIVSSRGEGYAFLHMLQERRIIEPILYDRQFRVTIYHITPLSQLRLFPFPEISPYNHMEFEAKSNYVYFLYVLKGLIRMPHLQILEKVITFVYMNEDFFNGEHRLMLYKTIIFPNFSLFFTHWNANIRHIFHRLLLFKMCRTRLSYLPRYTAVEMSHVLYSRIFKNRRLLRSNPEEEEKASKRVAEGNYSIFDIDAESQQKIWENYNYEQYRKSKRNTRSREAKRSQALILSQVRETQWIDVKLAEMMKARLHILMNLDLKGNANTINGRRCIPDNQFKYYWVSFIEFISLLLDYERRDGKLKPAPIAKENVYNNGVGTVEGTSVSWSAVNEMESRVPDPNQDIEFFLAYKQ